MLRVVDGPSEAVDRPSIEPGPCGRRLDCPDDLLFVPCDESRSKYLSSMSDATSSPPHRLVMTGPLIDCRWGDSEAPKVPATGEQEAGVNTVLLPATVSSTRKTATKPGPSTTMADVEMTDAPVAAKKKGGPSTSAVEKKKFEVKKVGSPLRLSPLCQTTNTREQWNAVALWAWDIVVDKCVSASPHSLFLMAPTSSTPYPLRSPGPPVSVTRLGAL